MPKDISKEKSIRKAKTTVELVICAVIPLVAVWNMKNFYITAEILMPFCKYEIIFNIQINGGNDS